MSRPNFPMMGLNMHGMPPNMANISHPPPLQMNMMPPQMGGFPGMMHPPMHMHGKIFFFEKCFKNSSKNFFSNIKFKEI